MFWKWVTRPRTDEELRALVDLECSCSPTERQEADHVLGERKAASLGFAPAWLIIEDCLYPGAQVDHTEVVSPNRLHRRASKWPRSLHGYLPYGPDMTIEGIRQWLKLTPALGVKTKVLQSLNNMLHTVGPFVAPHFIVSYTLIDVAAHHQQKRFS
jgi:hypothetical protein